MRSWQDKGKMIKLSNKNEIYLAELDPNRYWWTHGLRVAKVQSIRSYKMNKHDHQDREMRTNNLIVSDNNKDWRSE